MGIGTPTWVLEKLIIIVSISSLVMLVADVAFSWTHAAILELRPKDKFADLSVTCNVRNSDLQ